MNGRRKEIKIFAGNANPQLAGLIAKNLGIEISKSHVGRFSDGECMIDINTSVRGDDVYIIQSTSHPVNDHLMELLIMIDALKRASAGRITAVIPYFGYARQDRKSKARDPISAKLVANLLTEAGANRILTMDLHVPQLEGFFDIPVDHLQGVPILAEYFLNNEMTGEEYVAVSPDIGSVARARNFARRLDIPIAIIDKRRPQANCCEILNIVGDVEGKRAILVDDLVDTAGTLTNAATQLINLGAKEVIACCTHSVLSGKAISNIENSAISKLYCLDTIQLPEEKQIDKIKVLSVDKIFMMAIERIYNDNSVSALFDEKS
ncbi:MAG: ribose-phosphate pyrophosphokinase [Clostridia bacterium]|nr:ribose-phosphate pyrophosphokinase [Clostridia bacterium]